MYVQYIEVKYINNNNSINYFQETYCGYNNGLCRLNKNTIIVEIKKGNILILILEKRITKEINNSFLCYSISLIDDKGIFFVGDKDIIIYKNDNYESIQNIKNTHYYYIKIFIKIKKRII